LIKNHENQFGFLLWIPIFALPKKEGRLVLGSRQLLGLSGKKFLKGWFGEQERGCGKLILENNFVV